MMLLAKAALGVSGALVAAGAYAFHEGVIRVDVDEYRAGGSHVHMWVPAAMVPMAMHFVPKHDLCDAAQHAREVLPTIQDRKSTRLNSSHEWISYAVFCLKKKNKH